VSERLRITVDRYFKLLETMPFVKFGAKIQFALIKKKKRGKMFGIMRILFWGEGPGISYQV